MVDYIIPTAEFFHEPDENAIKHTEVYSHTDASKNASMWYDHFTVQQQETNIVPRIG